MHCAGRPVLFDHPAEAVALRDISFLEWPPFHCPAMSAAEIVISDRRVPGSSKRLAGMTADITGAPVTRTFLF